MGMSVIAGPSLGFFYGNCWGRGLLMAGFRTAAAFGFGFTAIVMVLQDREESVSGLGCAFGAVWAVSTVYDLATVKRAVQRRNEARLARRTVKAAVAPFVVPRGAGVRMKLSF
jgi:hypothetical protein